MLSSACHMAARVSLFSLFNVCMRCSIVILGLSFALTSYAQDIEEVIIEADIPTDDVLDDLVSVSAIDAEKLADAGIENVEDVAAYVPNLVLTQTETGTNIVIRGIGAGTNQGFDQSVGLYSDGVPLPRANMARAPFLDLSGVQVLRGPQYVLDGNYSIAGSVHMVTNLNTDEFEAGVDFNYVPSQNGKKLLLTVGGPINDYFAARVALQSNRTDGYIENVLKDRDEPEKDELLGRLVLGFNPSDNLSFKLKVERGQFDNKGRAIEIINSEATPTDFVDFTPEPGQPGAGVTRNEDIPAGLIATSHQTATDRAFQGISRLYDASPIDLSPGVPAVQRQKTGFVFAGRDYLEYWKLIYECRGTIEPGIGADCIIDPVNNPNPNGFTPPAGLLDDRVDFKRSADADEFSNNDSLNITLNTDLWLGEHAFKFTGSHITYELDELIDADFTGVPILETVQSEEYTQNFFKLDYSSPEGYFIEFRAGASYLNSDLEFRDNSALQLEQRGFSLGQFNNDNEAFLAAASFFTVDEPLRGYFNSFIGGLPAVSSLDTYTTRRIFEQESDILATYFQATLNWTDYFRTTIGARYTQSEKSAVRDLAIIRTDNKPLDLLGTGTTEEEQIQSRRDGDAISNYFTFFGIQAHTDLYTEDQNGIVNPDGAARGTRREEAFLPSLTLEWDVTPDLSLHSAVRLANKLGGYDARSLALPNAVSSSGAAIAVVGTFEFEDEFATTYELGAKWFLPAGLGELRATGFITDFVDLQTSRSDGRVGQNVGNAGEARSMGIEVEGYLQLTDTFTIDYSLAWIDFEFKEFNQGSCYLGRQPDLWFWGTTPNSRNTQLINAGLRPISAFEFRPVLYPTIGDVAVREPINQNSFEGDSAIFVPNNAQEQAVINTLAFDAQANGGAKFCNFSGQTNQYVADRSATISFNYRNDIIGLGLFKPTLDVLYNSGYFPSVNQDPDIFQDEYWQLNGRVAVASFDDIWEVAITGENLTNEKIVTNATEVPLAVLNNGSATYAGFIRPSRTIGLNLRYNFY